MRFYKIPQSFPAGIGITAFLILSACSLRAPLYPKPILLDESSVSIEYTYGNVEIHAPIRIDEGNPTAFKFRVFSGRDTSKAVISRMMMPGEKIAVSLPRSLFLPDSLQNRVEIDPQGGDFIPIIQKFHYTGPVITLPESVVKLRPVLVRGYIYQRRNGIAIAGAEVNVRFSDGNQTSGKTDANGKYAFNFPSAVLEDSLMTISAELTNSFPVTSKIVHMTDSKLYSTDFQVGPTAEFYAKGTPYIVLENLTPFRKGPENGAEILFMLPKDETIMVTAVAGDRLKAVVEQKVGVGDHPQYQEGWVLSQFVKPVGL